MSNRHIPFVALCVVLTPQILEAQGQTATASILSDFIELLPLIWLFVVLYVAFRWLRSRQVDWGTILLVSGVAVFLVGLGIILLRNDILRSVAGQGEFRGLSLQETMGMVIAWGGFFAVAGATAFTVGLIRLIRSRPFVPPPNSGH